MSSIVQVVLTRFSDGAEFEGMAWYDGGRYEAIWNEDGLRHVFHFQEDGQQIGQNKYKMRRVSV